MRTELEGLGVDPGIDTDATPRISGVPYTRVLFAVVATER